MKKYIQVDNYCLKLRAYPSKEQAEKIDKILHGLRVAYNVTAYEITHGNQMVTREDKKDPEVRWPNFSACMKKEWLDYLRENYEQLKDVPATSLNSSCYGVYGKDMKKSWENFHPEIVGKQARTKKGKLKFHKDGSPVWVKTEKPVKLPCGKWKATYYSGKRPRDSFTVQTMQNGFLFSDNSKTVRIGVTGLGKIKTRGWNFGLRFGDTPEQTFEEFYSGKKKAFGVTVSKDNCGDYYIVVQLQTVWKPVRDSEKHTPIGVDVGVKDLATTSDGAKYENKQFKRKNKREIKKLSRKISRRWGWSNDKFREAHKRDTSLVPSKGYESAKLKKAKLERKIARQRNDWNHCVSTDIVGKSEFIGIEDLNVKGMMANRHLAYSVSDAALYDVLSKISYKAKWSHVPIRTIGRFAPSSQLCHVCGYQNKKVKNLSVREWTCPECKTHHDRDVNAAINILQIAMKNE